MSWGLALLAFYESQYFCIIKPGDFEITDGSNNMNQKISVLKLRSI